MMTPFLINTRVNSFDDYIKSLDRSARKNYRYTKKHNKDLEYKNIEFDKALVQRFMELWHRQKIHGNETPVWAFDIGHVKYLNEIGRLRVFAAYKDEPMAVHFVEDHGGYVYCHPPMYDKKYNHRYLAKYMWFNLIRWAIETDAGWVDLGSGDRGSWRDLVMHRKKYPRIAYKWMYVPKEIKNNGEAQPAYYIIQNEDGRRRIERV